MFLKNLKLTNFRNYSNLSLEFDSKPTILVGNNAVGKSNLLEAVYLLSTTKSGRVDREEELVKQGEEFSRVEGGLEGEGGVEGLEIFMQAGEGKFSKRVKVNGVPRRVTDFIGNLPAVIFNPADINMVTGAPALRRWHLDMALAQVDTAYKKALTLYEQVLTNRNRVLKRIREREGRIDELIYWTEELIKYGEVVSGGRKAFLESMNDFKSPLGSFNFQYLQNQLTRERLDEYSSREIAAAATLIGPHRDDFRIVILNSSPVIPAKAGIYKNTLLHGSRIKSGMTEKGRDLAKFGSRGEQRTATLAFKLAQLEYMALTLGKRPILLLDDVFSELDSEHRAHVVEVVGRQQTIMATVELEGIPQKFLNSARILKVEDGKITE